MATLIAHRSHLKGSNCLYASLRQEEVSTRELVEAIANRPSCPLSRAAIATAIELMVGEIHRQVAMAKTVNISGLGKIRPAIKGKLKGESLDVKCIGEKTIRFTPAKSLKASLDSVRIDMVVKEDSSPKVTDVTPLARAVPVDTTGSKDSIVFSKRDTKMLAVRGEHLKVVSLCNAPIAKGEEILEDSGNLKAGLWLVPKGSKRAYRVSVIFTNTPKLLEFGVPSTLPYGREYNIVLCTAYSRGANKHYLETLCLSKTLRLQ